MAVLSIKDFPDDVYRALKIRAVEEGKTLRELIIEILTRSSTRSSTKAVKGKEG